MKNQGIPVLFPPMLVEEVDGKETITLFQWTNILFYLAEKHNLAGTAPTDKFKALQLCLSFEDLLANAHDVYHPVERHGSY